MVTIVRLSTFSSGFGCGLLLTTAILFSSATSGVPTQEGVAGESLAVPGEIGQRGGRLVVSLRAEPKTLNPLTAVDAPSREAILAAMQADLIHINRATPLPAPAPPTSSNRSPH